MKNNKLILEEIEKMLGLMGINKKVLSLVESNLTKKEKKIILEAGAGGNIFGRLAELLNIPLSGAGKFVRRIVSYGERKVQLFGEEVLESEYNNLMTILRSTDPPSVKLRKLNELSDNLLITFVNGMKKNPEEFQAIIDSMYDETMIILAQDGKSELQMFQKIKSMIDAQPGAIDVETAFAQVVNATDNKFYYFCLVDELNARYEKWLQSIDNPDVKFEPKFSNVNKEVPKEIKLKNQTDTEAVEEFQTWLNKNKPGWSDNPQEGIIRVIDKDNKGSGFGEFGPETQKAWDDELTRFEYVKYMKKKQIGDVLFESPEEIKEFKSWLYKRGKLDPDDARNKSLYDEMMSGEAAGEKTDRLKELWENNKGQYHEEKGLYAGLRISVRKVSLGEVEKSEVTKNLLNKIVEIGKKMGGSFTSPTKRMKIFAVMRPLLYTYRKGFAAAFKGSKVVLDDVVDRAVIICKSGKMEYKFIQDTADEIALEILSLRKSNDMNMKEFMSQFETSLKSAFPDDEAQIDEFFKYLKNEESGSPYAKMLNVEDDTSGLTGFINDTWIMKDLKQYGKVIKENQGGLGAKLFKEFMGNFLSRGFVFAITGRFKKFSEYLDELLKEGVFPRPIITNLHRGFYGIVLWAGVSKYVLWPLLYGVSGALWSTARTTKIPYFYAGQKPYMDEEGMTFTQILWKDLSDEFSRRTTPYLNEIKEDFLSLGTIGNVLEFFPFDIKLLDFYDWANMGLSGKRYKEDTAKLKEVFIKGLTESQKVLPGEAEQLWEDYLKLRETDSLSSFKADMRPYIDLITSKTFGPDEQGFKDYLKSIGRVPAMHRDIEGKIDYSNVGGPHGTDSTGEEHKYDTTYQQWINTKEKDAFESRKLALYELYYSNNITNAENKMDAGKVTSTKDYDNEYNYAKDFFKKAKDLVVDIKDPKKEDDTRTIQQIEADNAEIRKTLDKRMKECDYKHWSKKLLKSLSENNLDSSRGNFIELKKYSPLEEYDRQTNTFIKNQNEPPLIDCLDKSLISSRNIKKAKECLIQK